MTVRIPIQADGGQVAKVFEEIRKAMERSGQAGRELSKIDLSHPELKEHAEDLRKVIAHYDELKKVWRQLGVRTKATGQGGAAPWDLDLGRMYPTSGQAAKARETLGRRLLSGTSWGSRLPPPGGGGVPGAPPGGGGVPGMGIPNLPGLLKFTLGLAGLGGIASMARQGVGQAQQEAMTLDPLWRKLQETAGSFDGLRDKTRDLGRGLGVTYEKSVQLGGEFARLSGSADASGMARGARAGIGLSRGLGLDPEAGVSFMGRSRFKSLFSGGEERQFAAMIAAGVREGGMQAAPEKVLQAVDQMTDALVRRGANAGVQVGDMLGVLSAMNKSGSPSLRGEYGQALMAQIGQSMVSPGMGDAGQFLMYRALGVRNPFESQLARERGPFDRGDDGVMAIEKVLRQFRRDIPNDEAQRAVGMSNVLGIPALAAQQIDRLFADMELKGVTPQQADIEKVLTKYGGNQGADTTRLLTEVHNALTDAGAPLLEVLNGIRGAVVFMAGPKYSGGQAPSDTMTPEEFKKQSAAVQDSITKRENERRRSEKGWMIPNAVKRASDATGVPPLLLYRMIQAESSGDPNAVSKAGAQGLMQLMPQTAKRFGVRDPFNAEENVMGGAKYMSWLHDRYGSWGTAVGAYHAGEGNMDKYLAGKPSGVGPETQAYARRVMHDLRLDVHVKDSSGKTVGRTTRDVPLDTPKSSGTSAVAVP
jgi:hypothetical protein